MPFLNRVRLPIYITEPQFPTEANRFRLSNGTSKTLSVVIRKVYSMKSDYMNDNMHQRLVIALNHDTVNIEGDRYIGGVTVDSEYEAPPVDFLDYPLRQATVKLQVTPFDMTNGNCQTCDTATQLSLVDDDIGELAEGATGEINIFANDSICCYPPTAEIVSFATGYLDAATIDEATGSVSLTVKNPAVAVGSIVLATYRVTCPDGSYDEADVYGSIAGSEEGCEQPSLFDQTVSLPPAPFTYTIEWSAPAPMPSGGFEWQLFRSDTPGTPILTGSEMDYIAVMAGLEANTDYAFYVRSVCGEGIYSAYTEVLFTTPESESEDCGRFNVMADDGSVGSGFYNYSYMDCSGIIQNRNIQNLATQSVCMLMTVDNNPVYFEVSSVAVTYLYVEPC